MRFFRLCQEEMLFQGHQKNKTYGIISQRDIGLYYTSLYLEGLAPISSFA